MSVQTRHQRERLQKELFRARERVFNRHRAGRMLTLKGWPKINDDCASYVVFHTFDIKFYDFDDVTREFIRTNLEQALAYGTYRSLENHWEEFLRRIDDMFLIRFMDGRMNKFDWLVKLTVNYLEYCYERKREKRLEQEELNGTKE